MKLTKIVQFLSVVTMLSLIYIHMQMQIFGLAYKGKIKQNEIADLKEDNGTVAFDISRLKSSNHLGFRLLSKDSDLRFRDQNSVVQVVTSEAVEVDGEKQYAEVDVGEKNKNSIFSFLSLKSQAEAKTSEKGHTLQPWKRQNDGRF